MSPISVWGFEIQDVGLSLQEIEYLRKLPKELPKIEWLWREMDRVWCDLHLNNRLSLSAQPLGEYYMHPVWLMNGIFSSVDPASSRHRGAIAAWLDQREAKRIADFGGGFGELAYAIVRVIPGASVSIIEPYPFKAGLERIRQEQRIRIAPDLSEHDYDAIIAQDVLEHVEDPISLAHRLANSVRDGGHVVFANCFFPVMKCHLPSNFHLRRTFRWVMKAMGLRYIGSVAGAEHAEVFERIGPTNLSAARRAERVSRIIGRSLNAIFGLKCRIKRMLVPQ